MVMSLPAPFEGFACLAALTPRGRFEDPARRPGGPDTCPIPGWAGERPNIGRGGEVA
jgi:hypothetical protein